MKLLYWSPVMPLILDGVVREIRSHVRSSKFYLQVSPGAKAIEYMSLQPDEVLRAEPWDFGILCSWLKKEQSRPAVVIDLWGLLLACDAARLRHMLTGLSEVVSLASGVVVVGPRVSTSPLSNPSITRLLSSDEPQSELIDLSEESRQLFEAFLNTTGHVRWVQSAPTLDFLGAITGQDNLSAQHKMGMQFLPQESLNSAALFVSRTSLVREICRTLLEPNGTRADSWCSTVPADNEFDAKEAALRKGGKASIEKDLVRGLLVRGCSWNSFCEHTELTGFASVNTTMVSRSRFARWLYFMGMLEKHLADVDLAASRASHILFGGSAAL